MSEQTASSNLKKVTYREAGVDVEAGDEASRRAAAIARSTYRTEIIERAGIAMFDGRFQNYKEPLLLGGSDGVGTKLKVAFEAGQHSTVGIDLVAMSVNDLARRGAEPLVFLPYFATSNLDPEVAAQVAEGVAEGCRQANCSIIGGETAELPGFYQPGEYDLAGAAFGVVEKSRVVTGEAIQEGDVVLGLASSGLHSNGYSLARKILLEEYPLELHLARLGMTLGEALLTPTRIYVRSVLAAQAAGASLHGLAHITGGGFRKLAKIVPAGLEAEIDFATWPRPELFKLIQELGNVDEDEMRRTFNLGIGFAAVVPAAEANSIAHIFEQAGETVYQVGVIKKA
ncbi:MAG TPA: phosphoribosylformylglycinamidine cyclo-ligase [Chloroflexia bacterium]|nr:phosphoribosylformylglycinamidine cyclo-ligase [Chloroflexia bacterium]